MKIRLSFRRACLIAAGTFLLLATSGYGQTFRDWEGDGTFRFLNFNFQFGSPTDWGNFANWNGGVPNDATEVARFNAATDNDPEAFGDVLIIGGIELSGGESRELIFTNTLSIDQYGVDNSSGFDLSILGIGGTDLTADQTWSVTGPGGTTYSGSIANGGNVFTLNGSSVGQGTITGNISGTGRLIKEGSGTWTLSGANTYTGLTTLSAGTLALRNVNALQNTTLEIGMSGTQAVAFGLDGNNTYNFGGLGGGGTLSLGGNRVSVGSNGATTTFSGTISGNGGSSGLTGGLTKVGTGTLTLSGANTHTGLTSVSGGTLALRNTNALQNSTLDTGISGSQAVTFNVSGNNTYNIGGLQGSDALALGLNRISVGSNNASTTFSGIISGSGGGLTKVGTGTLTLSGANTHTGLTTVSGGTLALRNTNALQNSTLDTGISGSQAVTFNVPGNNTYNIGGLQGADALALGLNRISVGSNNASTTFSGSISGDGGTVGFTGGLTKVGTGTLTLSGTSSYSGETFIRSGIVNVANLSDYGVNGSLGNRLESQEGTGSMRTVGLHFDGGTLQYTGSTAQSTNRGIRVGLAGATLDASGTGSGTISFTKMTPNQDIWDTEGGRTLTLTGSNTGNNIFAINWQGRVGRQTSLEKTGSGTWVLSNPNNSLALNNGYGVFGGYNGGTTISGGVLGFVNDAIGGGVVNFTGNSTLRWESGNTQDITTGIGGGASRSVRIGDGVTATFNTNGNDVALSNAFVLGTNRTGGITKTGEGSLTLSANNSYQGLTTISDGTLIINGNQTTAGGNITVANGARLEGVGTTGADLTTITSGGTLAAGLTFENSGGSVSDLTFNSDSIFEWDINSAGAFSVTKVEGSVTGVDATFRILLNDTSGTFWDRDHTWSLSDIFEPSNNIALSSIFDSLETNFNAVNGSRGFSFTGGNLTWAAVPEPSSALVGILIGAGLFRRRRPEKN